MNRCVIYCLLISITFFQTACKDKEESIQGSWISVSINNPDPFFKKVMPNNKRGAVTADFNSDGSFTWKDALDSRRITGTYDLSDNMLSMHAAGDDDDSLETQYSFQNGKLCIATKDGFTFMFEKLRDQH